MALLELERRRMTSLHRLPAKDMSKTNEEQGLYRKFFIRRTDSSDVPGGKHDGCEYFFLDLTHDQYALETIAYYAQACKATHPELSKDLMELTRARFQKMEDEGEL
jgi:hypothetical protein